VREKTETFLRNNRKEVKKLGFEEIGELKNAIRECYGFIPNFIRIYKFEKLGGESENAE